MDAVRILLPIVIQSAIAGLILCVGLDAGLDDVLYLVRRPLKLARAFVAISLVPPVAAIIVTSLLPLSLPARLGVILMSLAPAPPFVPGSQLRGGGQRAYSYGLYAAFAMLTVVIVPASLAVLNWLYGASAEAPFASLVQMVFVSVLVPLALGMIIRARWPQFAARVGPPISRVAMLLVIAILVLLVVRVWPAIIALIGNGTVFAVVAISLVAIGAGQVMGAPDPRDQVSLSTAAATRHPGIALMIANSASPDKRVAAMIILYVLTSFLTVALYQAAVKGRARAGTSRGPERPNISA